jgi:hypothetical protein
MGRSGSRQVLVALKPVVFNKTSAAIKDAEQTALNLGEHHGMHESNRNQFLSASDDVRVVRSCR